MSQQNANLLVARIDSNDRLCHYAKQPTKGEIPSAWLWLDTGSKATMGMEFSLIMESELRVEIIRLRQTCEDLSKALTHLMGPPVPSSSDRIPTVDEIRNHIIARMKGMSNEEPLFASDVAFELEADYDYVVSVMNSLVEEGVLR